MRLARSPRCAQLKRGISSLREENNEMASTLSAAEIAARRDAESAELAHAKRLVSIVAAERDAQVVPPASRGSETRLVRLVRPRNVAVNY